MSKISINKLKEKAFSYIGKTILEFTYKSGDKGNVNSELGRMYLGVVDLNVCICQEGCPDSIELSMVKDITFEAPEKKQRGGHNKRFEEPVRLNIRVEKEVRDKLKFKLEENGENIQSFLEDHILNYLEASK